MACTNKCEKNVISRESPPSQERSSRNKYGPKSSEKKTPPVDKYYLVALAFFVIGFGSTVPASFFLTATDYWMYKFRDTSLDHYDPKNKTGLQINFASTTSIVQSIPNMVTTLICSLFGHKFDVRLRLTGSLAVLIATFAIFTSFVEVDTDTWQTGFFILTMGMAVVVAITATILGTTVYALIAKFPRWYLMLEMYGAAAGRILSSVLQITCLASGGTSLQVGMMYYLCGTAILVMTGIMTFVIDYSPLFHYYMGDTVADTRRPLPSLTDLKEVSWKMWPILAPMFITLPVMAWATPIILILIVPEHYEKGDPWTDKYFTPVTLFLMPSIIGFFSRLLARPYMTARNAKWFVILALVKTFLYNPLFLFCNVLPRNHLPVLFPHDWQYITLYAVNTVVGEFLTGVAYLSIPNLAKGKIEQAYLLMQSASIVLVAVYSPLNAVWANTVI
ncbi:hypothetical protein JTB14_016835 [Gonioctena quinquepunctata]|nr:hypothetical protein JTB14_016835 [Gonioctena quinquepunctata]